MLLACAADPEVELSGQVLALDGTPVQAEVTLVGPRGRILGSTTSDGGYTLWAAVPERFSVHASTEDASGVSQVCPLTGRLPPVFVGDGQDVEVTRRLLDVNGQPVPRQEVLLRRHWNGTGPVAYRTATDNDGEFTITLPAGAWTAQAGQARFPVLAGGPERTGLFLEAPAEGFVVATVSSGLHLTGPVPGNQSNLHVYADAPEDDTAAWSFEAPVESIRVETRRNGIYRMGLESAETGAVVQYVGPTYAGFAQAADAELWTALELDTRLRHVEEYGSTVHPSNPEAW